MRKILIIVNDFPPPINGGNMRVYKFSKYLLKHGWKVHILCNAVDKQEEIDHDARLSSDLSGVVFHSIPKYFHKKKQENTVKVGAPSHSNIHPTLLHNLLAYLIKYIVPDTQRFLWVKPAVKEAMRIIKLEQIPYIITSSPPHSTQLVGFKLKKRFKDKIKWIADFRDLWSLSHIYDLKLAKNRALNWKMEQRVLQQADLSVFVSEGIRNITINAFQASEIKNKSTVIHNGYDPDDFLNLTKDVTLNTQNINFSYIGTMFGPQTHNKLIEGILLYLSDNPSSIAQFHFVGIFDKEIITRSSNRQGIHFHNPKGHAEALNFMYSSDVCILLLSNDKEGQIAYSGKFFEYLKIRKPMLAIVPEGEVSSIIREYSLGEIANPDSEQEISTAIQKLVGKFETNKLTLPENRELINLFNREVLTSKLESLL